MYDQGDSVLAADTRQAAYAESFAGAGPGVKPLCEPWGIACSMVDADMANRCILVPHTGYTHIHMYDAWGPNMFTWCSFGLHTVGQVALPVLFCVKE